jgi:hypothetical protein
MLGKAKRRGGLAVLLLTTSRCRAALQRPMYEKQEVPEVHCHSARFELQGIPASHSEDAVTPESLGLSYEGLTFCTRGYADGGARPKASCF